MVIQLELWTLGTVMVDSIYLAYLKVKYLTILDAPVNIRTQMDV